MNRNNEFKWLFGNMDECIHGIKTLKTLASDYTMVTVRDFKDLKGVDSSYIDNKYFWTLEDLDELVINFRTLNVELCMPEPQYYTTTTKTNNKVITTDELSNKITNIIMSDCSHEQKEQAILESMDILDSIRELGDDYAIIKVSDYKNLFCLPSVFCDKSRLQKTRNQTSKIKYNKMNDTDIIKRDIMMRRSDYIPTKQYDHLTSTKKDVTLSTDGSGVYNVINPKHYQHDGLETIDVIKAFTKGLDGIQATDTGNVIKYVSRWKQKNGLEDLNKAQWYLNHLIKQLDEEEENK